MPLTSKYGGTHAYQSSGFLHAGQESACCPRHTHTSLLPSCAHVHVRFVSLLRVDHHHPWHTIRPTVFFLPDGISTSPVLGGADLVKNAVYPPVRFAFLDVLGLFSGLPLTMSYALVLRGDHRISATICASRAVSPAGPAGHRRYRRQRSRTNLGPTQDGLPAGVPPKQPSR